ncbi:MAG TPA: hypothetical protein VFG83_19410, partial [Kofleriaceae bacterium]|nr:hypothetical protein [Kofleriaceae bacterium]
VWRAREASGSDGRGPMRSTAGMGGAVEAQPLQGIEMIQKCPYLNGIDIPLDFRPRAMYAYIN